MTSEENAARSRLEEMVRRLEVTLSEWSPDANAVQVAGTRVELFRMAAASAQADAARLRRELHESRAESLKLREQLTAAQLRCAVHHVTRGRLTRAERREMALRNSLSYRLGNRIVRLGRRAGKRTSPARGEQKAEGRNGTVSQTHGARSEEQRRFTPGETTGTPDQPKMRTASILLDARGATTLQIAESLEWARDRLAGKVLVLATDSLRFDLARRHGVSVEFVPKRADLIHRYGPEAGASISDSRWAEVVATHEPQEIYSLDAREDLSASAPTLSWFNAKGIG